MPIHLEYIGSGLKNISPNSKEQTLLVKFSLACCMLRDVSFEAQKLLSEQSDVPRSLPNYQPTHP